MISLLKPVKRYLILRELLADSVNFSSVSFVLECVCVTCLGHLAVGWPNKQITNKTRSTNDFVKDRMPYFSLSRCMQV